MWSKIESRCTTSLTGWNVTVPGAMNQTIYFCGDGEANLVAGIVACMCKIFTNWRHSDQMMITYVTYFDQRLTVCIFSSPSSHLHFLLGICLFSSTIASCEIDPSVIQVDGFMSKVQIASAHPIIGTSTVVCISCQLLVFACMRNRYWDALPSPAIFPGDDEHQLVFHDENHIVPPATVINFVVWWHSMLGH